jgi:hypothetical protein
LAELQELDAQIGDPERYRHTPYALAEDSLRAALLSRGLGRPRAEVDGRFLQARRIAEQAGFGQQQSRIVYNHAWTTYFWFDDFREFINALDQLEALALGSDNAVDIEGVVTLYSLARHALGQGFLTEQDARTEARRTRLVSELERISAIEARPTNALEARTSLLILRMADALYERDVPSALNEVWTGLRQILGEAKGLPGFDLEQVFDLISEVGEYVPESEAFDILFEEMVVVLELRKSEGEGGKAYVNRAFQKLEKGLFYEAIRYFGRASDRLLAKEYEADLAKALIGSSFAYEAAGLNWAARNHALAAASHALGAFERHGQVGPYAWRPLRRLAEMEAKLGRVPQFLAAYKLQMMLWSQGAVTDEQQSQMGEDRISYDIILGSMLLATRFADLTRLTRLPDPLERLGLPNARMALLKALGHEDALREERLIPASETEQEISDFFEDWGQQREKYGLPEKPEFSLYDTVELSSIVIGCTISVSAANDPTAIAIGESVLGALEGLLATSIEHRMLPQVDRLQIVARQSSEHSGLPTSSFETVLGVRQAIITHGTKLDFRSLKELEGYPEWLSRTVLELATAVFAISNPEEWAEQVLGEERGFARAITFSNVPLMTGRVFGSEPKTKADDWIRDVDRSYPFRREEARPAPPKHPTPAIPLEFGKDEPPPELLDRSKLRHSDMRVMSLIDAAKWNEAKWSGVFFLHTDDVETYPPIFGLIFRESAPAKDIFMALEARLGKVDERKALRVSIIRGVSAANPSHYAVVIGSRHDDAEHLRADKQLFFVSRILWMTPESTENLDTFLEAYRRSGRYILAPAIFRPKGGVPERSRRYVLATGIIHPKGDVPELMTEHVIRKYDLEARHAWQIGLNDPDIVALDPDDPPVIPAPVVDAPVLRALERLRSKERRSG